MKDLKVGCEKYEDEENRLRFNVDVKSYQTFQVCISYVLRFRKTHLHKYFPQRRNSLKNKLFEGKISLYVCNTGEMRRIRLRGNTMVCCSCKGLN